MDKAPGLGLSWAAATAGGGYCTADLCKCRPGSASLSVERWGEGRGGVVEGMEGWCCTLWFSGKMRKDAAGNWEAMFLFTFSTAGVIRSHTSALHTQSFRNCTDLHKRIYDWVCCKITRAGILIETYSWHTKLLTVDHHWMLTKMRPIC